MIEEQGEVLGKAHLQSYSNEFSLSDIAVKPQARRRGLATQLITSAAQHAFSKAPHPLILNVQANNQSALDLYTKLGFSINNAMEFWRGPLASSEIGLTVFPDDL